MLKKQQIIIVKQVSKLALPMAASRAVQILGTFLGFVLIAHFDKKALAASGLISSCWLTCFLVFMAILFSVGVVTARLHGQKNTQLKQIFQQGCLLAIIFGSLLMLCFYFIPDLLLLLRQDPQLIIYVREYFYAFIPFAIPILLLGTMQQLCFGVKQANLVIQLNMIALLVQVCLAYLLVFGKLGFPEYGVKGVPYGFGTGVLLNVILLGHQLLRADFFKPFALFQWSNPFSFSHLNTLLKVGLPMSLQFSGELLGFSVLSVFSGWLGHLALSATQMLQQCILLGIVPIFAVSEATSILVSAAVSEKNTPQQVRQIGNTCIQVSAISISLITLILMFGSPYLIGFFIDLQDPNNQSLLTTSILVFKIGAIGFFAEALRTMIAGVLRGLYDTQFAMLNGLASIWLIAIPIGSLLAFYFDFGIVGLRIGVSVGFVISVSLIYRYWQRKVIN